MDSPMRASHWWETVETNTPTGQVAEVLFDKEPLAEHPAAERGVAF
jgi:hypothetical protein